MQSWKLKESRKSLQWSKCIPSSLLFLKTTSLKVVFFRFTLLRSQSVKMHSIKAMLDISPLEKLQESNTQFSYSPLSKRLVVKSIPLKLRSVINGVFIWLLEFWAFYYLLWGQRSTEVILTVGQPDTTSFYYLDLN